MIRRAILEGDIDKALKHMNTYYPHVLEKNEQVYFRLRCRKFIEMIRREAEMNLVGGDKRSHNGHLHPPEPEDVEMDDDVEDFDGQQDQGGSRDLTQVALLYGQDLQAEYAGDERSEVRQALEDIFSLIAYQNPLKESKVAHLLDRKGRVAVAEELNSAILRKFFFIIIIIIFPLDLGQVCLEANVVVAQNLWVNLPAQPLKIFMLRRVYCWTI